MKNKQYFVFWFKIKTAVRNHPTTESKKAKSTNLLFDYLLRSKRTIK
jgi:hypothetical protein